MALKFNNDKKDKKRINVKVIATSVVAITLIGIVGISIGKYSGKSPINFGTILDGTSSVELGLNKSFNFIKDNISGIVNYKKNANKLNQLEKENEELKSEIVKLTTKINDNKSIEDLKKALNFIPEKYQAKAVHGLAVKRDTYVANLIKAGTNVTTATAKTQAAVKTAIDDAIVALRERNFDDAGVIEITPAVYNVFKNNLIELSTNNPELIKKGIVGMYDNFNVVMSNNLAKDDTYTYCAVRSKTAIAFAGQINEVEAGRMEKRFSDYIRGLDTFGSKIIAEAELQVVKIPL